MGQCHQADKPRLDGRLEHNRLRPGVGGQRALGDRGAPLFAVLARIAGVRPDPAVGGCCPGAASSDRPRRSDGLFQFDLDLVRRALWAWASRRCAREWPGRRRSPSRPRSPAPRCRPCHLGSQALRSEGSAQQVADLLDAELRSPGRTCSDPPRSPAGWRASAGRRGLLQVPLADRSTKPAACRRPRLASKTSPSRRLVNQSSITCTMGRSFGGSPSRIIGCGLAHQVPPLPVAVVLGGKRGQGRMLRDRRGCPACAAAGGGSRPCSRRCSRTRGRSCPVASPLTRCGGTSSKHLAAASQDVRAPRRQARRPPARPAAARSSTFARIDPDVPVVLDRRAGRGRRRACTVPGRRTLQAESAIAAQSACRCRPGCRAAASLPDATGCPSSSTSFHWATRCRRAAWARNGRLRCRPASVSAVVQTRFVIRASGTVLPAEAADTPRP